MNAERAALAYVPPRNHDVTWWEFWTGGLFFVQIPEDVKRRLAVTKAAHSIANQLAPLDPEANREILILVAGILGVLEDAKEVKP